MDFEFKFYNFYFTSNIPAIDSLKLALKMIKLAKYKLR